MKSRLIIALGCILSLGTFAACGVQSITEPTHAGTAAQLDSAELAMFGGPKLLVCGSEEAQSNSATVGPLGGVVSVGGTSISIPTGALLQDVDVTVTLPKSQYMEVAINVAGTEHFQFEQPVVVTISYSRCNSFSARFNLLTAWYINSDTHDLLEQMPTVDNKLTQTVTFPTIHLSGYALAD